MPSRTLTLGIEESMPVWRRCFSTVRVSQALSIGALVVLAWSVCATQPSTLSPAAQTGLPTTYRVQKEEGLQDIGRRFYGSSSLIASHVLWHANPGIRNLGTIKAGTELVIPVLPDQLTPLTTGETIHFAPADFAFCYESVACYDVVISKDGSAVLPLGVHVVLAGLTPDQARKKIVDAYVPTFYRRMNMVVIRVQGQPVTKDVHSPVADGER